MRSITLLCSLGLLSACGGGSTTGSDTVVYAVSPLVIAPFVEGEYFCDDAVNSASVLNEDDAAALCASEHTTAADRVRAVLDTLGPPSSPSGRFELGYTLDLPLLRYFKQVNGQWVLDRDLLANSLQLITDVDRPVVVYLSLNHFVDSNPALAAQLAANSQNRMWTRDGPLPAEQYLNSSIIAWTLYDQTAPITAMRQEVFAAAVEGICKLLPLVQERIVAVSVLGETHELFPNFAAGPGFEVPSYEATDYSPVAVNGFRVWLSQKYGTIDHLNHDLDAAFASFNSINPPSKDIRTELLATFFEHIDPYAAGFVPIYGWIFDRLGRDLKVAVYLDGAQVGVAQTGLNRTDVTDAVVSIKDPNVGYRFNLDYRSIAYGIHTLEVLVSVNDQVPLRLARRQLVIVDRDQDTPPTIPYVDTGAQPISSDPNLSGTIDGPPPLQSLFYNPLADLWLQYRNQVIRNYIEQYAQIAAKSCIPISKIFSHQITPSLDGSWNGDLLAADQSKLPDTVYNQGTTLYGGAAFGQAFLAMKQLLGWTRYSVSEMHPQVPLTADQYLQMFDMHRSNGAVFVAPYYLSIAPARLSSGRQLEQFRIAPDNPLDGSDLYWQSIQAAMKQ